MPRTQPRLQAYATHALDPTAGAYTICGRDSNHVALGTEPSCIPCQRRRRQLQLCQPLPEPCRIWDLVKAITVRARDAQEAVGLLQKLTGEAR